MSDLIDRQALKNKICDCCEGKDEWCNGPCFEIMIIDSMPAIAAYPWHRVEEELPEIGKAVVVSIYGDMWVATRLDDKRFNGRMYWELSDGSWERVENDMYWMPIEPPKEDEHGNK